MDADEESRRRQYDGTARENDEVSKAPEILVFGILAKNNIHIKTYHQNILYF